MGNKDIISKELLKKIARDIATHILKIEIQEDMELIDKEFTRVEKRDADLLFKNGNDIVHAVVLAILCDFEGKDKQEVVTLLLQRLKALSDEKEYKNYLKMVNILSSNRDLENEVKRGTEMLSVDIEKTPFYQIGIEKGMERGIEKVVIGMLKLNVGSEIIQKSTGLSFEAIEALKKKLQTR